LPLPERQLIQQIRRLARPGSHRSLVRGIGDDCAILRPPAGSELLITTDLCLEDVHFRRQWHPAASVGHRCLARGLSDIAAMGGEPLACFLSLGLPQRLPQAWADQFLKGLLRLAREFKVPLAGGDIAGAEKITADIVMIGSIPSGQALLRSGARAGDHIYVTGKLGGSASVLQRLYAGEKVTPSRRQRHFYPLPRLKVAQWLRHRRLATAAIDLSDGLSVDLDHICTESKVSAMIEPGALPLASGASREQALHGGEDYELLFTSAKKAAIPAAIAGVPVTLIGEVVRTGDDIRQTQAKTPRRANVWARDERGKLRVLPVHGWEHFSKI
jgi:thiamine-monophosphate kinase